MSPSSAGGWVFVRNENMSESGCFMAARLDFQLLGFSTSLKPSGSIVCSSAALGLHQEKKVLLTEVPSLHFRALVLHLLFT